MYQLNRENAPGNVKKEYKLIDMELGSLKLKIDTKQIRCTPEFLTYCQEYKKKKQLKNSSAMIRQRVILFPIALDLLLRLLSAKDVQGEYIIPPLLLSEAEERLINEMIDLL